MENYFNMLVSESLDQFLGEWVDRAEDRWADREIDRYMKRKTGVVLEEDPEQILSDPYDLDVPSDIPSIKKVLYKLIDYKKGKEVTPEEFKNFCIWVTQASDNPQEASAIVSVFIEKIPSLVQALEAEKALDGGRYHEGFEVLVDKFRPKGPEEDDYS